MHKLFFFSIFTIAIVLCVTAFADVPRTMVYQGKLTDDSGVGLTGTYFITFGIYDVEEAGDALWEEDHTDVSINRGIFSVTLGLEFPIDLPFDTQYWLEIEIEGIPLIPRLLLTSSSFSMRAGSADEVNWTNVLGIPGDFSDGIDDVDDADSDESNELIVNFEWNDETNTLTIVEGTARDMMFVNIDNEADFIFDNNLGELANVDADSPSDGDGLLYDAGTWYASPLDNDCFCWRLTTVAGDTILYPEFLTGADDHFLIDKNSGIGIERYPSDTARVHIRSDSDKFGVLVESGGVAGSEIGLHTATSQYASLVKNAYFTGGSWYRFNTSSGSFLQEIVPGGGAYFKVVGSGANPITWTDILTLKTSGNVGIGTTNPTEKLEVNGTAKVDVLKIMGGSDLSEQFEVDNTEEWGNVVPGMVVSIDEENPGKLIVSQSSYDRKVAGIISGAGGVNPGMLMGQDGSIADGDYPIALTGRVYCLADASQGSIRPGDLLTTSDTPGHAMKVAAHNKAHGAIIGKAMTSLDEGCGLVLVLVSLH